MHVERVTGARALGKDATAATRSRFRSSTELLECSFETARVALLGFGERFEPLRNVCKALVASGFCEPWVHGLILVGLARNGALQVLLGIADRLPGGGVSDLLQKVEMAVGVAGFTVRGILEQTSNVGQALDIRDLREIEVTAGRLGRARKRVL